MDLGLDDDQQQLVDAFRSFCTKECPPSRVRDAEPLGFDADLWVQLGRLGGPAMGVVEELGGGGASLLDLALVAEQLGAVLAPVPFVDAFVMARLLAAAGATDGLARLLADPPAVAGLALHPAVDGVARLVPSGAVADLVVGLDGDDLVLVDGPRVNPLRNLGDLPMADRSLRASERTVLAGGPAAFAVALDEWRVLTASTLVGMATAALDIGTEYAKSRHQFGVPIGSFQSIARDLADVATAVDGARLLVREAAWAAAEAPAELPALAGMAFLVAAPTAARTASVALHVHGGYGFMLEYDIQLYYRRAKAWSLMLGDRRRGAQHLADALFGPVESQ
jgi:alkylation response protein AidB-like acyl-CoA dehydrogenase